MDRDTAHQDSINQTEWANPRNWTGFMGLYGSPRDTRILVPNNTKALGYLPNTAHLGGKLYVAAVLVILLGWPLFAILARILRG